MNTTIIRHADIVTDDGVLKDHCVVMRKGRIAGVYGDNISAAELSGADMVDAGRNYVSAGFIDLHIHGMHGYLVNNGRDDLARMCEILPRYGVTGFLPTVTPLPAGQDVDLLENLASCVSEGAQILGFHLEGPFLSLTGALSREALGAPDIGRAKSLIRAARPYRAIFSISPEIENAPALLKVMTAEKNPAFITHTAADVQQTLAAIAAGACHATHFYDVFYAPESNEPGVRPCGAVEAILADPNISVDFILDGVHVHPAAVKMAMRCKDRDKICLITDAVVGAGLGPGKYEFSGRMIETACPGAPARTLDSGGLAGSGLTMNMAVKNAVELLEVNLPHAIQMVTSNPAKVLGLKRKGLVRKGFDADVTMFDSQMNVLKTWVNGVCCHERRK